jgi:hypothetical protein
VKQLTKYNPVPDLLLHCPFLYLLMVNFSLPDIAFTLSPSAHMAVHGGTDRH